MVVIGSVAVESARVGLRVFPVKPGGKVPLRRGWQRNATSDVARVEATWREVPDANVGVACGAGLLVIDTDSRDAEAALRDFGLPDTPRVRTARGRHFYLHGDARNRAGVVPGVDVRGVGGFVVGAGSVHATGTAYTWELAPADVPFADVPGELLVLITAKARRDDDRKREGLPSIIERGQRNAALFCLACKQRGIVGLDQAELFAGLWAVNERR